MPEGEVGEEREVGEEEVVPTDDEAEGAKGNTVYQRGGTRLPAESVTPALRSLITPDGET